MNEQEKINIETALKEIDEDYIQCFKTIREIYDYLATFGLNDFNRHSKYKWSFDKDKKKGFSYVCIRHGTSLTKKILVKRRALIEDADLYKWVGNKDQIKEAMDEAYQFIYMKVNTVKKKFDEMKEFAEDYREKFDDLSEEAEEARASKKKLRGEPFPGTPGT